MPDKLFRQRVVSSPYIYHVGCVNHYEYECDKQAEKDARLGAAVRRVCTLAAFSDKPELIVSHLRRLAERVESVGGGAARILEDTANTFDTEAQEGDAK